MAADVPFLEVVTGDCGFKGKGGGALSGSELSHLVFISRRQITDMTSASWRRCRGWLMMEKGLYLCTLT